MIAFLLTLVRAHALISLCAAGFLAVLSIFCVQRIEIHHLRTELAVSRADDAALAAANRKLIRAIGGQNAAIRALGAAARSKAAAAARRLREAQSQAQRNAQAVQALEARKTTRDPCADMRFLVDDYFKTRNTL